MSHRTGASQSKRANNGTLTVRRFIQKLLNEDPGARAIEYGVSAALILLVIRIALTVCA